MERGGPSLSSGPGLNLARKQEKVVSLDNRMDSGLGLSIARQAELVFSDTAIARDAFLLKHIRRNREGYVSLKLLISAYKPIKRLTLDWRDVALAIQTHSSSLEVNSEGTKVRRLAELPPPTEESPCCNSRTVVATTFPVSSPSIRDVVNVFSVCGDIIQVRVLRPGNPTSGGVRKYLAAHPHLQQKVCAFVEFETVEAAERAVKELPVRPGGLQVWEYLEPGEGREKKKGRRNGKSNSSSVAPPPQPDLGVIGDRVRLVRSSKEEVDDEDDAWSVDEGIHVEDFPGEELGMGRPNNLVDNSEWTDLVNKTVDFVFD